MKAVSTSLDSGVMTLACDTSATRVDSGSDQGYTCVVEARNLRLTRELLMLDTSAFSPTEVAWQPGPDG